MNYAAAQDTKGKRRKGKKKKGEAEEKKKAPPKECQQISYFKMKERLNLKRAFFFSC